MVDDSNFIIFVIFLFILLCLYLRKPDANSWLNRFGQSLKCPDHYRDEGKKLAHNVFGILRVHYSVARVYIVGSFGKNTDVIMPDLDLTFVINYEKPPFTKVLNDIEQVLKTNHKSLQINIHQGCKKTDRTIQFQFRNGIDVDLLPAANFPNEEIKAKILEDPEYNARIYSSSLAGKQKAFMKSRNEYTHTLVRLAKFWFKTVHFKEKLHGGSAMIEIIAAAAAEKSESYGVKTGWQTFINYIRRLDSLKIAFEEVKNNEWNLVSKCRLGNPLSRRYLVPKVIGEWSMLDRKCFVIDTANPFQDYLFGKEQFIGRLKMYANVTKQRLTSLVRRGTLGIGKEVFISTLFTSQPENLVNLYPNAYPRRAVLTCSDFYPSIFGKLEVKKGKENLFQNKEIKRLVEALRSNLVSVVHTYFNTEKYSDEKSEETKLRELEIDIKGLIQNNLQKNENQISKKSFVHKEMDVTIIVPYKIDHKTYAVRLSLGW